MIETILNWAYIAGVVLLLFNLTIFIHELGHFMVGRWRGAKIERFAIWFGPALWKKDINGVEWRLGCIPLGGYVAFPQLAMEAVEGKSETPAEELKPLLPRDKIPILFAGSIMNVILGFIVATVVWVVGVPREAWYNDLKVGYVSEGSPEWNAGIRPGDVLKSINGNPVTNWEEIRERVAFSVQKEIQVGLERKGQIQIVQVVPGHNSLFHIRELAVAPQEEVVANTVMKDSPAERAGVLNGDRFLEIEGQKIFSKIQLIDIIGKRAGQLTLIKVLRKGEEVGLSATPELDPESKMGKLQVALDRKSSEAMIVLHPDPISQVKKSLLMMYDTFRAIIHRKTTGVGVKDLSGPVGIAHSLAIQINLDIRLALSFMVMLNINLAVVNLLPIPVLDGGHIVFSIIEWIRRKPVNQRFLESTQMVFVALLLTFMLYVTFNDFGRMIKWGVFSSKNSEVKVISGSSTNLPAESK